VILLDADLEAPSLAERLRVKPWPGLAELAHGRATVEEVLQPAGDGISVITAGEPPWSPDRLAMDVVGSKALEEIGRHADVVIADLSAMSTCSFTHVLAGAFAPPALLVVRAGITPLPRVSQAIERLPAEPAIVLNGTQSSLPRWLRLLLGQ
jgi:Mrp family chromosome partitioning ATPase